MTDKLKELKDRLRALSDYELYYWHRGAQAALADVIAQMRVIEGEFQRRFGDGK